MESSFFHFLTEYGRLHQLNFRFGQCMRKTKSIESTPQGDLQTRLKKYAADLARANRKLHDQERQLELIIDSIPALVSYVDNTERYTYCNKTYEQWFDISRRKLYGKTIKEIRGKKEYNIIRPYIKKALGGQQVSYDHSVINKDGTLVYFTATYAPHFDEEGNVQGFFILATDISERKLAEERLKYQERQFRHLVDGNVIGVIIKSLDGPILEANEIFLKMAGYTRAELNAGKVYWRTMTPKEHPKSDSLHEKEILTKGAAKPFEKQYIRKDGSLVPVLIGDVLLDKKEKKTITFILDMTKQKELDQRKDEFIALASHELKTPLTSIKMYAQLVHQSAEQANDSKSIQLTQSMDKQIDKLTDLVNDLLDVSRIQSGKLIYKKELFAFDDLVKDTIEELQRVLGKHTLLLSGETNEKVKGDRDRLQQVLTNLVTNASKYSPKSNKIMIKLKKQPNSVLVAVQDFGIGIPRTLQDKIFDRFFQIDRPLAQTYSGLGLGLYITKEIVDRHQGEIWVKSEKGKGTTFYFSLPIYKKRTAKMTKAVQNS